ncbi:hypothetical protein O9Z70_10875 [Devosia sp. YIM 151766]|uniref:hypothetical protein n=1 Tax=Devosia sp. YIM 151766 TaxID=3017325 RepID=UPI00255C53BF|nr:hypothetical protein [Devosia sp. YIM 151766]WIY51983.1 hypothetical protein O9Z70_10875 [Devosia sp. YIM 151766]
MTDNGGFDERFGRPIAADEHVVFATSLLGLYGHRCAVTGRAFAPADILPHPDLDVMLFQPLSHRGLLVPGNALVVEIGAADLLRRGVLMINDDYEAYIARPELLDPPGNVPPPPRKLRLPADPALWPDRSALAYHRSLFQVQ